MNHRCPWPGCTEQVSETNWGCRAHWYRLPNNLRAWIGRAYRIGIENGTHPTQSWRRAHTAALAWAAHEEHGDHTGEAP
ncbi:hypothetical protein [Paraburkholderia sp. HD33-4]|uniref:hypothetical protein n=1 Tax=Paraburkholderia sp. HD33-4 TaxID=2883242 RepID=UPI001F3AC483|nr:hypothetical protein [Paraburkholderia sp. HD33-4]